LFPSQTFAVNMQIKTTTLIAIAIGCASAENAGTFSGSFSFNKYCDRQYASGCDCPTPPCWSESAVFVNGAGTWTPTGGQVTCTHQDSSTCQGERYDVDGTFRSSFFFTNLGGKLTGMEATTHYDTDDDNYQVFFINGTQTSSH
jgi:hypothetical protein